MKNDKDAGVDEIPREVRKTRKFDDQLLWECKAVYNQNTIERWIKGCTHSLAKKCDLEIVKNYRGITLTSIWAKIQNARLFNCIEPENEKILKKNQNGFKRNRYTISQILTIGRIFEGVCVKRARGDTHICKFLRGILLHTQSEDGSNT